jgi:hypothetical protein
MGLDGTTVAAIVTGILALTAALATAWMSGWNEERTQARANKKALARYSVPLIIAAWDLSNWFYDILEDEYYSKVRCDAYGDGWSSQFTSYLLGQYFAGVHIVREMTHFFAHIRGEEAEKLKRILWKIQDEFISMNYDGRENLEMRWFEGDVLAAQEHMTEVINHDGAGTARELRTIGWLEFQKKYAPASESGNADSPELYKLFEWYEDEFQRIVYRRFKSLYTNKWPLENNPQDFEKMRKDLDKEREEGEDSDVQKKIGKLEEEENKIRAEKEKYPNISVIVPDHRVRRLQHLLSDLVVVLDSFTAMKLNRPVRRCGMLVRQGEMPLEYSVSPISNPLRLVTVDCIPCDCSSHICNPGQEDFEHRQLRASKRKSLLAWRKSSSLPEKTPIKQESATLERKYIVERSKV